MNIDVIFLNFHINFLGREELQKLSAWKAWIYFPAASATKWSDIIELHFAIASVLRPVIPCIYRFLWGRSNVWFWATNGSIELAEIELRFNISSSASDNLPGLLTIDEKNSPEEDKNSFVRTPASSYGASLLAVTLTSNQKVTFLSIIGSCC